MSINYFEPTDLIINPDGSIYHLRLKPDQVAPYIILVGDPERVPVLSKHFDRIECQVQNREIISHTGYLGENRIMVVSTGMGTDNIDIIVHELDALVNIDFNTRIRKPDHTRLCIIRLGTSGAIQPDIPLNAIVLSEYGIGMDGLLNYYLDASHLLEYTLAGSFTDFVNWPDVLPRPYAARGSDLLIQKLGSGFIHGITVTASGFYGPQGRSLRLALAHPQLNDRIIAFAYLGKKIINYEMETSALYGLCKMMGHEALTICLAIANRATKQYDPGYRVIMEELGQTLLKRLRDAFLK